MTDSHQDLKTTSDSPIPLIDLEPWITTTSSISQEQQNVVEQIRVACEDIGFFAIQNHGVPLHTIERAWEASRNFFDLESEEKLQSVSHNTTEYPYGYEATETLTLGHNGGDHDDSALPDLKETFAIGPNNPESGMPPRRYPARPEDMQTALDEYYVAMEELAARLLTIFAVALDLPENWFSLKFDRHQAALRLLNYPNLDTVLQPAGQLRAGAHTDYGALTILKSGGPGLQVQCKGTWVDVPYLENAFIINIGDLMQRWTNGTYVCYENMLDNTVLRVLLNVFF